ncbi:MAG: disulfide bond formation protein B [Gammaproteobacteria bacterium]|nr:disulfide bond formation protein B [Gammaproteobacteria bacterium]
MLRSPRLGNLFGLLGCTGLMGYALYAQYGLGLEPCPLCIFQRLAVIGLGVAFAAATLHAPAVVGRRVYGGLMLVVAAAGVGVAGRHLWLQSLPPERVPACGPGLDYMLESFPLLETLQTVLSGSGECAKVDWELLGVAMPGWVMVSVLALGGFGVWNNWRRAS